MIFFLVAAAAAAPYNEVLGVARNISDFFIPRDPVVLWGSVWIFSVITRNVYVQYLSTTFIWLDTSIACAMATAARGYCGDAQMIAAFYSTLLSHSLIFGPFPPHPMTTTICSFGALISMISMLDAGTCSFLGVSVSMAVGAALGYLRILLYADVMAPT